MHLRSLALILREERSDVLVVESGDEGGGFVVIEMVLQLSAQVVELKRKDED